MYLYTDASDTALLGLFVIAERSFNDVEISCYWSTSIADDCYGVSPLYMQCGVPSWNVSAELCEMELLSGYSGFNCEQSTSECYVKYQYPTVTPTNDPTLQPTTPFPSASPTLRPTISDNIIYVRDYGCDYGYCYNIDGDFTFNCQYNPWFSNTNNSDIYQYCCINTDDPTYQPSASPTMEPTVMNRRRLLQTRSPSPAPTTVPTAAPTATPIVNPTASPSQPPTSAPTFTPSIAPTSAPTVPPTAAPTDIPSAAPSNAPTAPPTSAPTTPPTAAPTASPTFGPTCKSIEYSWECFHGRGGYPNPNGCADLGYNGNGIFDIGEGEWIFPYNLTFGSGQVVISGDRNDGRETILKQTQPYDSFIGCYDFECWLTVEYITILAAANVMNYKQIWMQDEGHLYINSVIFDGNNYNVNDNGDAFWTIDGELVTVIFEDCVFRNNDVVYEFMNGADVTFIGCTFESNMLTVNNGYSQFDPMFEIDGADVKFDTCTFKNNSFASRSLFKVYYGGSLELRDCQFIGNKDVQDGSTSIINLGTASSSTNRLNIMNNTFIDNDGFEILLKVDDDTHSEVMIDSALFINNTNIFYDIYATIDVPIDDSLASNLTILNSAFINGDYRENSLKIENQSVTIINTKWVNYDIIDGNAIISISGPANDRNNVTYKLFTNELVANNMDDILFRLSSIDFVIGVIAINNTKPILTSTPNIENQYERVITNSYFSQNHGILFEHEGSLSINNSIFDNNYNSTFINTITT